MKFGFILPIYNEEKNISILYKKLKEIVLNIGVEYEFLFIDDKGNDNSLEILKDLQKKDKNVKIIEFSRNFGHEIAVKAGIDYVDGDYIIMMDTDLQDPPDIIEKMYQKIQEGYDIVYARRKTRHDGFFKDYSAYFFYRFINKLSDIHIPTDTGNYRIFTKSVLLEVRKLNEQSRFIRGLFAWIGYKQASVEFDRGDRIYGESGYPFSKMLSLSLDAIFSFSVIPLRVATILGFLFSVSGFIFAGIFFVLKLLNPELYVFGITTVIILLLIIGGIQLIILGIIGEYIGRIYKETKQRPLYIIKKIHSNESSK